MGGREGGPRRSDNMGSAMSTVPVPLNNLKVSSLGLTWSLDLGFKPETVRNDT